MLQVKKLRLDAVLLLFAAGLTFLLSGCAWLDQADRERGPEKTYIVVVDKEHSFFSELDHVSSKLDGLLGDGWDENSQSIIIICQ